MTPPGCTRLDELPPRLPAEVDRIVTPAARPEWMRQLGDLGFEPGEQVQVMVRGVPGGDPLVVRVAGSTYALRRAEAACVIVRPLRPRS